MKKIILLILAFILLQPAYALQNELGNKNYREINAVRKLINSQVRYANRANFKKFISTYDENYSNSDGFNLDNYASLVKDIWSVCKDIKYEIKINEIVANKQEATASVVENSHATIPSKEELTGELNSESISVYHLKKINGKWKVISDKVLDECSTMLYGDAKNLDIKLNAPKEVQANTEYTAALEFTPPKETIAIASIVSDLVEYPQKSSKEVFRVFPEDHILERLFTANNKNLNEYIVASIGLTKSEVKDLSIKLSLTGYGYAIRRVNVIPCNETKEDKETKNVKNE